MKALKRIVSKAQTQKSSVSGYFSVRDFTRDYGIELKGNQQEALSTHLQKHGEKSLGQALEKLEKEIIKGA